MPLPKDRGLAPLLLIVLALLALPAAAAATTGIKGTVTGPGSVEEVEVCVVELLPSETCTFPGPSGSYELLGLDPGTYRVEFLPSYRSHLVAQYYNHKAKLSEANKVVVPTNVVIGGIDADLSLGGEFEGTVTDSLSPQPLEGVEVCARDAVSGADVSCSHTDGSGAYRLPSVPPGSYRIGFWGEGPSGAYAPQYYAGKPDFFSATPVSVAAGETIAGLDAGLEVGAAVRGAVRGGGSPLAGIRVCILQSTAAAPLRCADTDTAGAYELAGLASGSYQLAFSPEFSEFSSEEFLLPEEDGWQTQYYAGSADRAGATTLQLSAPESRGIDAELTAVPVPLPAPPAPPLLQAPVSAPVQALPPPATRPKHCRKGFRKRRVKGKVRCVKRHHRKRHHRRPAA